MSASPTGIRGENTASIRPAKEKNCRKVESRPEVIGGLPLWFAVEAAEHLQRFVASFKFGGARGRHESLEDMHTQLEETPPSEIKNLPAANFLRDVADVIEEELSTLRTSLTVSQSEAERKALQMEAAQNEMRDMRDQYSKQRIVQRERNLGKTVSEIRIMLCKEQTRRAAAERKIEDMERMLEIVRKERDDVVQDGIKVSVLYIAILVAFVGFVVEGPYGGAIVHGLLGGVL